MSQSSESSPDDEWVCDICKTTPESPLVLEAQLISGTTVLLEDINGDIWVYCWGRGCGRRFHLKCTGDTKDDLTTHYFCCYCEDIE